ncbi:iron-containing alcohol dehydrogenase [Fretibacterium sp. OH1220_COT-178]|uniref:iron-containing alcohol dehydrogenase n=1 Tax=Fretibacterium sp. OH1220_COT-178 TaxID=2491047 RepID=UPI000F5D4ECD|nr:iron-containing alcohol dehydrogenase [Fretibacterium sp. OH1220_COT-178]RRD66314.1 iron-containing alcohol dehydrogenase [Fretibacterium sp. OH1220_COT-178]
MRIHMVPPVNLIGRGCIKTMGREAAMYRARRAFVVASSGGVGEAQAGLAASILKDAQVETVLFCQVMPNPTIEAVEKGVELYRASGCDLLVAVGGGSALDAAKGIGLLVSNGGRIAQYEGEDKVNEDLPPFIAVSTTSGSGSEVTRFAVISDADHSKLTLVDRRLTPDVSINDPEMMMSMPPALTAATGMDAMTHAVEAYVSREATPVTDAQAWKAIQLVAQNLPAAVKDGTDMVAREKMCCASFLAGTAFNNAGLGLVHAMSHPLGGHYNLPHGLCNALLLPVVCRFNLAFETLGRFSDIAIALGVGRSWRTERDNAETGLKMLFELNRTLGLPKGLKELGVRREDLSLLAERAMEEAIGRPNPRKYDKDDVLRLYEEAY